MHRSECVAAAEEQGLRRTMKLLTAPYCRNDLEELPLEVTSASAAASAVVFFYSSRALMTTASVAARWASAFVVAGLTVLTAACVVLVAYQPQHDEEAASPVEKEAPVEVDPPRDEVTRFVEACANDATGKHADMDGEPFARVMSFEAPVEGSQVFAVLWSGDFYTRFLNEKAKNKDAKATPWEGRDKVYTRTVETLHPLATSVKLPGLALVIPTVKRQRAMLYEEDLRLAIFESSKFTDIPYADALRVETVWLFYQSQVFVYFRCVWLTSVLSVPRWIQRLCNLKTKGELSITYGKWRDFANETLESARPSLAVVAKRSRRKRGPKPAPPAKPPQSHHPDYSMLNEIFCLRAKAGPEEARRATYDDFEDSPRRKIKGLFSSCADSDENTSPLPPSPSHKVIDDSFVVVAASPTTDSAVVATHPQQETVIAKRKKKSPPSSKDAFDDNAPHVRRRRRAVEVTPRTSDYAAASEEEDSDKEDPPRTRSVIRDDLDDDEDDVAPLLAGDKLTPRGGTPRPIAHFLQGDEALVDSDFEDRPSEDPLFVNYPKP